MRRLTASGQFIDLGNLAMDNHGRVAVIWSVYRPDPTVSFVSAAVGNGRRFSVHRFGVAAVNHPAIALTDTGNGLALFMGKQDAKGTAQVQASALIP